MGHVSGSTSCVTLRYGVIIEGKRFDLDDMKGFWLTSGQEISVFIRYNDPNTCVGHYVNANFLF